MSQRQQPFGTTRATPSSGRPHTATTESVRPTEAGTPDLSAAMPPSTDRRGVWSVDPTSTSAVDRMLALTYRVARQVGLTRRASMRLCRQVVLNTPVWEEDQPSRGQAVAGRRARALLLTTLRAALGPRVDRDRLDRAVRDAVLADEMSLLPTRQQAVLRWVLEQRWTVGQVIERTGWTHQQVSRLLRAALTTVTVCGQSG